MHYLELWLSLALLVTCAFGILVGVGVSTGSIPLCEYSPLRRTVGSLVVAIFAVGFLCCGQWAIDLMKVPKQAPTTEEHKCPNR